MAVRQEPVTMQSSGSQPKKSSTYLHVGAKKTWTMMTLRRLPIRCHAQLADVDPKGIAKCCDAHNTPACKKTTQLRSVASCLMGTFRKACATSRFPMSGATPTDMHKTSSEIKWSTVSWVRASSGRVAG